MSGDRQLAFRYRPAGREPGERVVEPLGLVAKGAAWYLVAAYWSESARRLREGLLRYVTTLRVEAEAAADLRRWHPREAVEELAQAGPKGWPTFRVGFDSASDALFVVLGLSARAEVLEPAELRRRVGEEAAGMLERSRARAT